MTTTVVKQTTTETLTSSYVTTPYVTDNPGVAVTSDSTTSSPKSTTKLWGVEVNILLTNVNLISANAVCLYRSASVTNATCI
jgi:hypothetical protein